jgi:glycosyltransferase involved in cell wall biosynthesis
MNIWILNHYATTPEEPATRNYDIGKELVKKGYGVTVFASGFSHYAFRDKKFQGKERWRAETYDGVRFIWLRTFPYRKNDWRRVINMLSYFFRVIPLGLRLKERPDVILASSPHPFAVLAAYILSRFKKSRFFFEVKDLWPQTLVEMGTLSEKSPITWGLRKLEKFLYQKAERIIILLPHADDYITNLGIPKDKIVWIPNGVDLSRYEDLKPYDGGISEPFTLMYAGGFLRAHRLDVMLEAAKIMQSEHDKPLRYIFVGDGPERTALIKLSKEAGLDNISFPGLVPKHEMYKVTGQADAFIGSLRNLPQLHKYGISLNKIFDYLASGRPVLFAANLPPSHNPVEEAKAGITVPPENAEALAQAITRLIAMKPEERIRMGKNGRQYVEKNHDIRMLAHKLERLF